MLASDSKTKKWIEFISADDSPYEFTLGLEKGTIWQGEDPCPNMQLTENKELHVRRFVMQKMKIVAGEGETALLNVDRLVAELEGGSEIELSRTVYRNEDDVIKKDENICESCGERIRTDDKVEIDGCFYHSRCVYAD